MATGRGLMSARSDLIVVGGGPAGAAAGIWARQLGMRVILFERRPFPRHRPGETLHPGVESIFRQLGVAKEVEAASELRPSGQMMAWGGLTNFTAYGSDRHGDWRALQVMRAELDAILLTRFEALGGTVVQPAPLVHPIVEGNCVLGVTAGDLAVRAPFTVDASGAVGWLRRFLCIPVDRCSPPLVAHHGYALGSIDSTPRLEGDSNGWVWTAQVRPRLVHWTRLAFYKATSKPRPPAALASLQTLGRLLATDVTWRRTRGLAGRGYFLAGEAAVVTDPAASHGVLRALMSGMMAAHAVVDVLSGRIHPETAAANYIAWLGNWFDQDRTSMSELYARLGWTGLARS